MLLGLRVRGFAEHKGEWELVLVWSPLKDFLRERTSPMRGSLPAMLGTSNLSLFWEGLNNLKAPLLNLKP